MFLHPCWGHAREAALYSVNEASGFWFIHQLLCIGLVWVSSQACVTLGSQEPEYVAYKPLTSLHKAGLLPPTSFITLSTRCGFGDPTCLPFLSFRFSLARCWRQTVCQVLLCRISFTLTSILWIHSGLDLSMRDSERVRSLFVTQQMSGRAGVPTQAVWAYSLCFRPQHLRDSWRKFHFAQQICPRIFWALKNEF